MEYAYLALAVVLNAASYIVFKVISARAHDTVWYSLFGVGLALGAANVAFFTAALRRLSLGIAYPAFAGASITAIVFVSVVAFSEQLKPLNALGALLVVAGIAALSN